MTELMILVLFPAALVVAAVSDFFTLTIPNWISLALALGFAVLAVLTGMSWTLALWHVLAGVAMLAVGFLLFSARLIGGGDAKLFAAAALWIGWQHLFGFALYTALVGGALALLLAVLRFATLPRFLADQAWARRLHDRAAGVPYGIALAGGGLLIYPYTAWFAALS